MADELTISIAGSYSKSGLQADTSDMGMLGLQFTVSGSDFVKGTQSIGFSASEAIGKGEITTPGFLFVKNTDGTNYVEIEKATFTSGAGTVKLKAGEVACFRSSGTAPHALANTAAVTIQYLFIED